MEFLPRLPPTAEPNLLPNSQRHCVHLSEYNKDYLQVFTLKPMAKPKEEM